MYHTVSTIDSPQFINLEPLDINPLMSRCEIKVLYTGKNRNHSIITKDVATEMAKTLRGAPIVGYYKEENEDFGDHGNKIIIDDKGVQFKKLTRPYGFVSPDAEVWFQLFEEIDDKGNHVEREYLMTTGYLWANQYPEVNEAFAQNGEKNQSMELDSDTLSGEWTFDDKDNINYFIINDAIFSSLCILGDDVEPCFEDASVKMSKDVYSLDDNSFSKTLFSMMKDLKQVVKGGSTAMDNEKSVEDFAKNQEEEEKKKTECSAQKPEEKEVENEKDKEEVKEDEEKKKEKDYSLMETEYEKLKQDHEELIQKYSELNTKFEELKSFKLQVEDEKKTELIDSFYMLSDEDKKDVIDNKSTYSLDDIKAKLSIICVDKKVSFAKEEEVKVEEDPISTFNLNSSEEESVPAYIQAIRNTRRENK